MKLSNANFLKAVYAVPLILVTLFLMMNMASAEASTCSSKRVTITSGTEFECVGKPIGSDTTYELVDAPVGMAMQPKSGVLRWAPTSDQMGSHKVGLIRRSGATTKETQLRYTVSSGQSGYRTGLYVAPDGNDSNSGYDGQPLATLQAAVDVALPGETIYIRGGIYRNPQYGTDFTNRTEKPNFVKVTRSGTAEAPITIRPHRNEFVKIQTDNAALLFREAAHWVVRGIEFEGHAQSLDLDQVLELWWAGGGAEDLKITARGISTAKSFDITVDNCVIHDFPGAGLGNNYGSRISLTNSVLYNNGWWSSAGTHGVSNSKLGDKAGDTQAAKRIQLIKGNLIYGNQSSVISHVFSKDNVTLEIDEGNGLHLQNNAGLYSGSYDVRNNLVLYNGKSGLGLNTIDGGSIRNNSFYHNAQAVNSGEISLQTSTVNQVVRNLFHALPNRRTIKDSAKAYINVGNNAAVASLNSEELPASVAIVEAVFANPAGLDFSPSAEVNANWGVPAADRARFAEQIHLYGLDPKPAPVVVTEAYVDDIKARIIASWPDPAVTPFISNTLTLDDKKRGHVYTYDTRHGYPDGPGS